MLAIQPAHADRGLTRKPMTHAKPCPDGTKPVQGKSDDDHDAVWCEKEGGVRHGHYLESWPGGKKKREGEYRDGQRQGLWTSWYDDGQTESIGSYKEGKSHGHSVVYYPNGKKQEEGEYREDEQDGLWTTWYDNGQKKVEARFVANRPVGRTVSWYESGQKKSEQEYDAQHKETGHWLYCFKNGQLQGEGDYKNGQLHGVWREWDAAGKLLREKTYRDGEVISEKVY